MLGLRTRQTVRRDRAALDAAVRRRAAQPQGGSTLQRRRRPAFDPMSPRLRPVKDGKKIKRKLEVIGGELQALVRAGTANVIDKGKLLIEAQEQLDHGKWLPWLAENFGSSVRTAQRYMLAATFAAKYDTVSHLKLQPRALYALADEDMDQEV